MDPQTELTMLETAYTSLITGGVKSYRIGDRELTALDAQWLTQRMDLLRSQVIRTNRGMAFAAQFRKAE